MLIINGVELPGAKFFPGQVVCSIGAGDLDQAYVFNCIRRHVQGDWGLVDKEDAAANNAAIEGGDRLLSAYAIDESKPAAVDGENRFWIMTEADRSSTTVLLPDEY